MTTIITELLEPKRARELRSWAEGLPAHRGHTHSGEYWHVDTGVEQPELGVWWTTSMRDLFIEDVIDRCRLACTIDEPVLHTVDCVWAAPFSGVVNPHVDTPYRFRDYQGEPSGLGEQFIVALEPLNTLNGTTGIVPGSERYIWPIDECYRGAYTEFFAANCEQYDLSAGDALRYDARTLHSTMPNMTDQPRCVMALSYVSESIYASLQGLDEAVNG